jgi:hypothetical protein
MAKNTSGHDLYASREVGEGDEKTTESVVVKPGQDIPEGVDVDEEYTRERDPESDDMPDQTRDELVKIAKANLLPYEDDWNKDQLTQAIRLHNEAVVSGGSVDWDAFKSSGGAEAGDVGGSADDDALRAEYRQLTGRDADGRWKPARLQSEVTKAREAKGGSD